MLLANKFKRTVTGLLPVAVLLLMPVSSQAEDVSLKSYQPELPESFVQLMEEASMDKGANIFERKCSSCHDSAKEGGHGKGPHLWNVVGRKAGTIEGFQEFSDAMTGSGHDWTLANLNYYLTNTKKAVPGRTMNFRGIRKEKDRAALIKFLNSLQDSS